MSETRSTRFQHSTRRAVQALSVAALALALSISARVALGQTTASIQGYDIGQGLEDSYALTLSAVQLSDLTIRVTVTPAVPTLCQVAAAANQSGAGYVDVKVPGGSNRATFYVLGL